MGRKFSLDQSEEGTVEDGEDGEEQEQNEPSIKKFKEAVVSLEKVLESRGVSINIGNVVDALASLHTKSVTPKRGQTLNRGQMACPRWCCCC